MPHTILLQTSLKFTSSIPSHPLNSTDKGKIETGMRVLALANGAPCSGSIDTLAAAAVAPVVLMTHGERQLGYRWYVLLLLLIDWCVEERRLPGGGKPLSITCACDRRIRTIRDTNLPI